MGKKGTGNNCSGEPLPESDAVLTSIDDVHDIFQLPRHMVAAMSQSIGADKVRRALQRLDHVTLTTSFSGCGMAETGVEALAGMHGCALQLGPALDWDPHCQAVLHARWPDRCVFNDIHEVVNRFKRGAGKRPPKCRGLHAAWCCTHEACCDPAPPPADHRLGLRIEIAGPACPPWSAFGKRLGTEDPRYKSHEAWVAKIRADPPDVLVFENVERYPPDLLAAALGDIYHYSESNLDLSEVFSLPMARPRLYLLLWRKSTCKWAGPEVNSWIEAMAAVKIEHKGPFDPEIFAAAPDMQSTRRMSNSEEKHFRQYENLIQQGLLRKTPVVDLRQSEARPVTALVNGCLPTLRTSSGSLYLVQLQQFLSGKQLMRAQGWPVHQEDSDALGLAHVELPASVGKTALVSMAGNAMFGACPVLAVFAALLYIEKV